jgi:EAL domain-containing protein (putative c-di-GMP-specific phosphodiesterase class I)/CheY-like chemotaxis protein
VRGLVQPLDFIPLAEATGLMTPIGEWVLRTACAQNQAWQAAGLRAVPVAVNVSARQVETQDLVALTAKILGETGLVPSYLELELTESAVMGNADAFIGLTEKLKGLSVNLAIDDFGTGYSSLSYLKRFLLDRLKIDQSFVRDVVQDPGGAAIVLAVITLAHSLGLSVIAEGVETEAQLNFLRVRGCDEMQGYYFSKPLPAAEFEQLLRDGRKLTLPLSDDLPGYTLLLVDDEPSVLAALRRQLRGEGYHMLAATSAQEGMELLALHEVAVVMSDLRMPQTGGAEFLAKVRTMYPDTVRIILSGYSDLESITDVVNRGEIYKFVEKPWDGVTLKRTLADAFRHYAARQAARGNAGPGA